MTGWRCPWRSRQLRCGASSSGRGHCPPSCRSAPRQCLVSESGASKRHCVMVIMLIDRKAPGDYLIRANKKPSTPSVFASFLMQRSIRLRTKWTVASELKNSSDFRFRWFLANESMAPCERGSFEYRLASRATSSCRNCNWESQIPLLVMWST